MGDFDYPLKHPYEIHLRIYRDSNDPVQRLNSFKNIVRWVWPEFYVTWNYWADRMVLAHCQNEREITLAAGAGIGKSRVAALIGLIFWLSDPKGNACIVASTTMESIESRIWGYVSDFVDTAVLPIMARAFKSKPPKVLYPGQNDKIHGIYAVAIPKGEEKKVIGTIIGRHPKKKIMLVLDEATEIDPVILNSIPNLERGVEHCQLISIGNSSSKHDLHGAMATPEVGWDKIDPVRDWTWRTVRGGICLYFYPFDSPAIHERDPVKKILLSKFLVTEDIIADVIKTYGTKSDAYLRFVLGFWGAGSAGSTFFTEQFLDENSANSLAEWSGINPLVKIAALDPAVNSDAKCMLRLGVLGTDADGNVVLDFRGGLMFRLDTRQLPGVSTETRMCNETLLVLNEHRIPLDNLVIDATGLGRLVASLLRAVAAAQMKIEVERIPQPLKVISVRAQNKVRRPKIKNNSDEDPNKFVSSPIDLWSTGKEYIQMGQVKGVDKETILQLTTRKTIKENDKTRLETKEEYAARMRAINPKFNFSPDEADTLMLCICLARIRFGWYVGQKRVITKVPDEYKAITEKYIAQQHEEQKAIAQAPMVRNNPRPNILNSGYKLGIESLIPKS